MCYVEMIMLERLVHEVRPFGLPLPGYAGEVHLCQLPLGDVSAIPRKSLLRASFIVKVEN